MDKYHLETVAVLYVVVKWCCLAEEDLTTYYVIVKTTKFQQSIMLYCKLQYAISLGIILAIINYDYKKEYRNIIFI